MFENLSTAQEVALCAIGLYVLAVCANAIMKGSAWRRHFDQYRG